MLLSGFYVIFIVIRQFFEILAPYASIIALLLGFWIAAGGIIFLFGLFETLKFHHSLNGGLLRKPQSIRVEFGVLKNKYDA